VNTRNIVFRLGLVGLLGAIFLLPPVAVSQNAATKRKVSHRVVPEYPAIARQMNITGKVKIAAVVAPDGHVKSTHAVGGSPLLVEAATKALKGWKFAPGPKETTEVVEFDFSPQQ